MGDQPFLPGDVVTRDGTDEQLVIGPEPGDDWFGNFLVVRCIKAPDSGWCAVGEEENNLPGRYTLVRRPNKIEAIPLSPKDAEFLEARRFQVEEIVRMFGGRPQRRAK